MRAASRFSCSISARPSPGSIPARESPWRARARQGERGPWYRREMGEEIALFPLSSVVLFPRVRTPLHIFEPRYRQMAEHALAGDRSIGMVAVPPEHVGAMAGDPPVYPVGCAGVISQAQRL